MYTLITNSDTNEEYKLIIQFLKWHRVQYKSHADSKRVSKCNDDVGLIGWNRPVLLQHDMITAVGFFGIVDFLK